MHPHHHAHTGSEHIFCFRCGERLKETLVENRFLPTCPSCGLIVYLNPKVAAGAIIENGGGVVLLRRGIEPAYGKWTFPGGYVNRGERAEDAAIRETLEEVGLNVSLTALHGVYSYTNNPIIIIVYRGVIVGGTLNVGPECLEVCHVSPSAIPWDDLAFPSTTDALKAWVKLSS